MRVGNEYGKPQTANPELQDPRAVYSSLRPGTSPYVNQRRIGEELVEHFPLPDSMNDPGTQIMTPPYNEA